MVAQGVRSSGGTWWEELDLDTSYQDRLGVDTGESCAENDNWEPVLEYAEGTQSEWREVSGACFAAATPKPMAEPQIVCTSPLALAMFGTQAVSDVTAAQMCGNDLPCKAVPAAHCYCGHQFGLFAGQLGDGAAVSLGTAVVVTGTKVDLQLKGIGATPFTRSDAGTGRKRLGPMVQELFVSEALAAIGVPTTRTLAVSVGLDASGDEKEPCAVLVRAARSFLRLGSFEVCLPRHHDKTGRCAPSAGDIGLLRRIADYCIDELFNHLLLTPQEEDEEDEDLRIAPRYCELVFEVTRRTARLAAAWYCLGAVHGMLNTDNISVAGETLDHGSFAFLDATDFNLTSKVDSLGRYSFGTQAEASLWACQSFAQTLLPLHCTSPAEMEAQVAKEFNMEYESACNEGMRKKLGLSSAAPELAADLAKLMESTAADWTCTFRALTQSKSHTEALSQVMRWCSSRSTTGWEAWLHRYKECLTAGGRSWDSSARRETMEAANPIVVPRRWLLDKAVRAAEDGQYDEVQRLLSVVTHPYAPPDEPSYAEPPMSAAVDLSPLDPASLGPMGVHAVEALDNPDYWQRLCPELHVLSPDFAQKVEGNEFTLSTERVATLQAMMEEDGVFTLSSDDLPFSVDVDALARGMDKVYEAGWPATCILAYDEPWIMAMQLAPLLRQLLPGTDISFDWVAFRVPTHAEGHPPHRDKDTQTLRNCKRTGGFSADGTPQYATCWIALVDVPTTSSCLMCIPRRFDSGYLSGGRESPLEGVDGLCHVRPLPLPKGGAAVFSHRLYHWSRNPDAVDQRGNPSGTRFALSISPQDGDFDKPCLPLSVLPLPPLRIRVALAAGQWYQVFGRYMSRPGRLQKDQSEEDQLELLWACFLSCSQHFRAEYSCRVYGLREECLARLKRT